MDEPEECEASEKHQTRKQPFGRVGHPTVIVQVTDFAESRTHVAQAGDGGGEKERLSQHG